MRFHLRWSDDLRMRWVSVLPNNNLLVWIPSIPDGTTIDDLISARNAGIINTFALDTQVVISSSSSMESLSSSSDDDDAYVGGDMEEEENLQPRFANFI